MGRCCPAAVRRCRRIGVAIVVSVALFGVAASARGAVPERVEVRREVVNLRGAPSTRAPKVGRAKRGERFTVLDHQGDWYEIRRPGGDRAWIFKRLVRPTVTPVEEGSRVRAKGHYANLRARPSRRAKRVGRLKRGTSLAAVGRDGDWIQVERGDGRRVWVAAEVVRLIPPDPAAPLLTALRRDYPGVVRWGAVNEVVLDHYHEAELDLVVESSWHFLVEAQRLAFLRQAARGFADLLRGSSAYRHRYHNRPLVVVSDPSNTVVGSATPRQARLF